MSDLGNIDDDPPTGEDGENTSKKSERKRQREKQRRSDLANAFDELANLLSRIEPDDLDASSNSRRRRRRNSADDGAEADADAAGMTRLDLIGRTVDALRRLHRENAELRQNLLDQQRRSASAMGSNEDTEVLVMVPTLTPSDPQGQPGQYQSYYSHPQQSARYHPPQEYHQQPQPPMGFYSSGPGPSQYEYGYSYQAPPQPWNHPGSMQPPQHHVQPPPPPVPPGQMVGYHGHHPGPSHHQHHGHSGGPTPSPTSARGEGN